VDSTEKEPYINHHEVDVSDIYLDDDCDETIDSLTDSQCLRLLCKIGMWQIEQSGDLFCEFEKVKQRINMLEYNFWEYVQFYCAKNGPFEQPRRPVWDDITE
jgi:hypothetical protein